MQGDKIIKEIEEHRDKLWDLEQKIWKQPEGALHEEKAAAWTASLLEEAGFQVERGIYGNSPPPSGRSGEKGSRPSDSLESTMPFPAWLSQYPQKKKRSKARRGVMAAVTIY